MNINYTKLYTQILYQAPDKQRVRNISNLYKDSLLKHVEHVKLKLHKAYMRRLIKNYVGGLRLKLGKTGKCLHVY